MKSKALSFLLILGFLAGCGGEKTPEVTNVSTLENLPASAALPAVGEGIIRGTVKFSGTVPAPAALDVSADPVCVSSNQEPLYSQELRVAADGAVRDAFVFIKEGLPAGAAYPIPAEAVVLDQHGCRYTPHVLGVRVNQPVTIINSDGTLHNVHAQTHNSTGFNLGMPLQGMKSTKKFSKAEVMAHFKCDVHPWMSAYLGIMDHPFFAVTGEDGAFEIKGLPAGKYTLSVWQEKLGTQDISVEVPASGAAESNFTFAG